MSVAPAAPIAWDVCASPLGPLTLVAGERGLVSLAFPGEAPPPPESAREPAALAAAVAQVQEYLGGARRGFDLPLDLAGTAFQRRVWQALRAIPYGATVSYGALAVSVSVSAGRPAAVRAVGAAVGRTPVPIVVPCHRVVGADGALTGYRGGLPRKRALLDLERRAAHRRGRPVAAPAPLAP